MPYADNNGVKIYYEVEGKGPPLVLATGANTDLTVWKPSGFIDAFKDDYQLVMFDARGHGRSDKPHEASAYGLNMAGDVIAVLDDIGISKAHYYGYSMGALVGYRLAAGYNTRFYSFILGGGSPYRIPDEGMRAVKQIIAGHDLLRTNPDMYLQKMESALGRPLLSEEKSRWLALDTIALANAMESILDLPRMTDTELAAISAPCLLFCGEFDGWGIGAKESVQYIKQARFVSLKGHDHVTVPSDLIIKLIKEFLTEVSET